MDTLPITYRGAVYPWHCDHVGHMNVAYYVGKFDEATWNLFNMLGLSPSFLRAQGRGMAALEQTVRYRRELHPGDVVTVRSRLLELEGKRIRFRHLMENGETGELAAETEMMGVHMDTDIRRACPFPEDILENGRAMLALHAAIGGDGDG